MTAPLVDARRHRTTVELGPEPARPGGEISVMLTAVDGSLIATVADNGVGIDAPSPPTATVPARAAASW